jgi:hypothetical protein
MTVHVVRLSTVTLRSYSWCHGQKQEEEELKLCTIIQNTKLGKEGKKRKGKRICGSYLSLALHVSLVSYSEFWTSCLRPKCQVPKTKVPKTKVPKTKVPKVRTVTPGSFINLPFLLYITVWAFRMSTIRTCRTPCRAINFSVAIMASPVAHE